VNVEVQRKLRWAAPVEADVAVVRSDSGDVLAVVGRLTAGVYQVATPDSPDYDDVCRMFGVLPTPRKDFTPQIPYRAGSA
jgi:hypothetical protein